MTQHVQLRHAVKDRGFSTKGNSSLLSVIDEVDAAGGELPAALKTKQRLVADSTEEYNALVDGVTVLNLTKCFPEDEWERVLSNGWASVHMPLLMKDRRFLKICLFDDFVFA